MKFNTKDYHVWMFSEDGSVDQLIPRCKAAGVGVILKVLDGPQYMATFDHHPDAIDSPTKAATIARRFEEAGVPVSFWQNPRGTSDISYEARAVLETDRAWRPRAWYFDTEPYAGFWQGTPDQATRLIDAVKGFSAANANGVPATTIVVPDARPWALNDSMAAFCAAADAIAPQCYWRDYVTNGDVYARYGFTPKTGADGHPVVDANFVVATAYRFFSQRFPGKPVLPVLQGNSNADEMRQAIDVVRYCQGLNFSVWRAGVVADGIAPVVAQWTPPGSADSPTQKDPALDLAQTLLKVRQAAVSVANTLPEGESVQNMQNIIDFFKSTQGK